MKKSDGLLSLIQQLAETIEVSLKTKRDNDPKLPHSTLQGIVAKIFPLVPQFKKELALLSDDWEADLISQAIALNISDEIAQQAVELALVIVEILLEMDINTNNLHEIADIDIKNPEKEYWFQRTDGKGKHQFFKEGNYLVNSIPAAAGDKYYNVEIYNSPYTDILPKNVVINPYPVDNPNKEPNKYIYDLFLNIPYDPSNKVVYQSRIKVENLKGGSRGWGFWNTSVFPFDMQIAWFAQYDGKINKDKENDFIIPITKKGFYVQTQNGLSHKSHRLPDLDEGWHDYRVELSKGVVEYFIDGRSVYKLTTQMFIPDAPMAFHSWVDNAIFGFSNMEIIHILQKTSQPRLNFIESMSIVSMPQSLGSASPFYTKQTLLPQSQSPAQLSGWLSANHPDYDLASWCFFGNIISENGAKVDAVSSKFQSQETPISGLFLPLFESGFVYNDAHTDGYIISGTGELAISPSLSVTNNPWSVVVNYGQGTKQSIICISLISGTMGFKDAIYMITADVSCIQGKGRLSATIKVIDRLGIVNEGYGPGSFLPQWMTNQQQEEIKHTYSTSMKQYLEKKEDPMRGQGAYYYSAPMLDVLKFKIRNDKTILAEGSEGTLWMDYIVQSFNRDAWTTVSDASRDFFAIQFPELGSALMFSAITMKDPKSKLYTAKYFTRDGKRTPNGALVAEYEWNMDQIKLIRKSSSKWQGKQGANYHLGYWLHLNSPEFKIKLLIQSIRDDQEINSSNTAKYEGVFTVTGEIQGVSCEGYAWGELHSS